MQYIFRVMPKLDTSSVVFQLQLYKGHRVLFCSHSLATTRKPLFVSVRSNCPSFCPLLPTFWPKNIFLPVQVGLTGACPEFCVEIYQPVCGSNGETYSNGCYLQMVTCNLSIFKAMITITWNLILNGIFQAACASTTPITEAYQGECAGISMLMFPTLIFLYNNTKMIFLLRMSC